jgi:polyhydroxybutyrate depolymerase
MRKFGISKFGTSATLAAALLTLAAFAATARDQEYRPVPAPGDHNESLEVGAGALKTTRTFVVHVPVGFDGKSKVPVVFMLHGAGGTGAGAEPQTGWAAKSDREGFIAVFPDGTPVRPALPARFLGNPRLWNDGSGRAASMGNVDDVGFVSAMIDYLEARYSADPDRIYCTGFSNGASMTFSVGVNLASRVAAVASVSGHLWYSGKQLAYPVPLLFIIGTDDPLNPLAGGNVKLPWGNTRYHPPVDDSLKEWERMLGCGPQVTTTRARNGVDEVAYDQCAKGGEVVYYTVKGLGHVWPGGKNRLPEKWVGKPSNDLNATDIIWDFFKAHPRTAAPASSGKPT